MSLHHFTLTIAALVLFGTSALHAALVTERSIGEARIVRIETLPTADLVVLDAGQEAGLRQSMVCSVTRSGDVLGELLLVELRPRMATALILDLAPGRALLSGDRVAVKTVSTTK